MRELKIDFADTRRLPRSVTLALFGLETLMLVVVPQPVVDWFPAPAKSLHPRGSAGAVTPSNCCTYTSQSAAGFAGMLLPSVVTTHTSSTRQLSASRPVYLNASRFLVPRYGVRSTPPLFTHTFSLLDDGIIIDELASTVH